MNFRHEFVDHVPKQLQESVLYVSTSFGTAVHLCASGCGEEVVTPLGPSEWKITYDGRTVSLEPSIGNWSLPCRSHYWIEKGMIHWARGFSEAEVTRVRQESRKRRDHVYRMEGAEPPRNLSGINTQRGPRKVIGKLGRYLRRAWGRGRE